jgi:Fis family transcriptional regulator
MPAPDRGDPGGWGALAPSAPGLLVTRGMVPQSNASRALEIPDAPSSAPQSGEVLRSELDTDWPTLAVLSRRYIDRALEHTRGNKTRAADLLGIDRRTLNRILARERARRAASA